MKQPTHVSGDLLTALALFSVAIVAAHSAQARTNGVAVSVSTSIPTATPTSPASSILLNDRGTIYTQPYNGQFSQLAIALNDAHSGEWYQMSPSAIKVSHGVVHLIRPNEDSSWSWFPYSKFISYERNEVAAGRNPLRLTATYAGKSRPVYWNWSLGFPAAGQSSGVTDQTAWEQGVNIADDRYVKWLIDNYINPVMLHRYNDSNGNWADIDGPYPNEWLGMDEIAINYGVYGVLDDNGHWVGMDQGPVMDSPFPNGSMAFHQMFQTFFRRLHEADPGLHILANLGTPDSWHSFEQDFTNVDGLSLEDIFAGNREDSSGSNRDRIYKRWTNLSWWAGQGKVGLWRSLLDPTAGTYQTDLRSELMGYLMIAGPNTAWAPEIGSSATEITPTDYSSMKAALGPATEIMISQQATVAPDATYTFYTRHTQNGIAYVNETGATVTVPCPSGVICTDRAGVTVTSISIPDLTGDYMLVKSR